MDVSIIIPTLNEERCLAATVDALRRQRPREVIVVDGGSSDGTCAAAADADQLLHSEPGRARQMNLGAAHAGGAALLFLHADCTLEDGALAEAEQLLAAPGVVAGCFSMRVQAAGWLYRSIEACATARVRLTGLAYGDQGLFLNREAFEQLGGFPALSLMEDLFFSRLLHRRGRIAVARRRVWVSPRRWQQTGLVRQTLRNWMLTALALGGVPPDRLASYYPVVR